MAITIDQAPADWCRVFDSNRLMHKISSTNSSQINFKYCFELWYVSNLTAGTYTQIGTNYFKQYPLTPGYCYFNPAEIYSNYLTSDFEINSNTPNEALNSATYFKMGIREQYGDPPEIKTAAVWTTGITIYNGTQNYIPYDTYGGNNVWVMAAGSQGMFLSSAMEFRVDPNDYVMLYYLADKDDRPTHIKYTVWYWKYLTVAGTGDMPGDWVTDSLTRRIWNQETPGPPATNGDPQPYEEPPRPKPPAAHVDSYTCIVPLTYTSNYATMFYIPAGPAQFSNLTGATLSITGTSNLHYRWVYYKVDLTDVSGNTYNSKPVYFYKLSKCDKYEPWQIFWLNPHGGFDHHTFYKKNYMNYEIERTNWTHRYSDNYVLGERGLSTMAVDSTEIITLNTDWLTATETQILTQLVHSPEIYALYKFGGVCYKIPYVCVNSEFEWKSVANEKMPYMAIQLQPAHKKIIQRN